MVPALLSSPCVAPCSLQMSLRILADPYVSPGRGDDQRFYAAQRFLIAHRLAVWVDIPETFALALSIDARLRIRDVAQPRRLRGFRGVSDGLFQLLCSGQGVRLLFCTFVMQKSAVRRFPERKTKREFSSRGKATRLPTYGSPGATSFRS